MMNRCPGSLAGTPTLKIKKCPECGSEVEVFSNDVSVKCDNCGFQVFNDVESCVQWCKYAKDCVGEELYKKFKRIRVAFIGVGNTVRSVMAEALAKEINTSSNIGFVSGGTSPNDTADTQTVEVLGKENIPWRGRPKDVARIGVADLYVMMGPEVEIPKELIKGEVIQWDIPNPVGKGLQEYQQVASMLKEKVAELIKEVSADDQKN